MSHPSSQSDISAQDNPVLWRPDPARAADSAMAEFARQVNVSASDYKSLHLWSVTHKEDFWSKVWDFCEVIGDKGNVIFTPAAKFQDARFFPEAKLNYAENLLRRRDKAPAIFFRGENKTEGVLSYAELYEAVSRLRQALQGFGVVTGDRVAGYLPNKAEAVIAVLATASLGAVWSSASPDFGVQGVLDRFGQITPKVMFVTDTYSYNGKTIDCVPRISELIQGMPGLSKVIVVPYGGAVLSETPIPAHVEIWGDVLKPYQPQEITFERFGFDHPLFIMFSSGTTGVPKCIVHGAGGTLLQHLKEHKLHCNMQPGDVVFYYTTCGWMMWNWLVSSLASEATLALYDGSPFLQKGYILFDYAAKARFSFFGASAKYIDALRSTKVSVAEKKEQYDLRHMRMMASTGSPLSHESFDYVYKDIMPHGHLASISGGTDIISCFVLGNPLSAVRRGEIQGAGLGMDVDVFDDTGRPVRSGKGELVCKTPFPSMPTGFWNDQDGAKFSKAYFERFPGFWHHGDWCEWTIAGGMIIHGRSDATLNPGGVRIGTAEIYRVVEQSPEIKESIAIGQDWDNDVRVILFVTLHEGAVLDDVLIARIKKNLRDQASPRHVPAKIIAVKDIPRTKNGKLTELAVRDVIHGRAIKNVEALLNPEALALYKDLPELQS